MKLLQMLFVAAFAVLPALILAATPYDSLYVHVPFEFVAAGQIFSAGDYQVQRSENGIIMIQGNGKAAATISIPGAVAKPGAPTGLKFSNDGQRERLVGVQVEGEVTRTILPHVEGAKKVAWPSR